MIRNIQSTHTCPNCGSNEYTEQLYNDNAYDGMSPYLIEGLQTSICTQCSTQYLTQDQADHNTRLANTTIARTRHQAMHAHGSMAKKSRELGRGVLMQMG